MKDKKPSVKVLDAKYTITPGIGDIPDRWVLMVTVIGSLMGSAPVSLLLCSDSDMLPPGGAK